MSGCVDVSMSIECGRDCVGVRMPDGERVDVRTSFAGWVSGA